MSTTQAQEQRTQFDYLLNALEHAAQSDKPAAEGYGAKRAALFAYVRDLEARATPPSSAAPNLAREVKNALSINGHIDNAFRAALGNTTCADGLRNVLVSLAHTAVEIALAAAQVQGRAGPVEQSAGEQTGPVPARPATDREALIASHHARWAFVDLANRLRAEALAVFDGPECSQSVRDAIEWFAGSIAAAPHTQAAENEDAALTESERVELLDWVTACQSAYHIESTPNHRFGGLTGQLTENREAVCEYVNELLAIRAARKDGKS